MSDKRNRATGKEAGELIARFTEGFNSGKMTLEEGESIIEQLRDLADDATPRVVEMLAAPSQDARSVALVLLRELGDSRAVKPLRRMLANPDCSDEEKLEIIQVLDELGSPIDEATFRRAIPDPAAVMQRSTARMLEVIEDPAQVEAFLATMEEGPSAMQEHYVRDMLAPLTDRRLLLLLTALLHNEYDQVIVAAIDAIERLKEPATIPLLEERAQYDPSRQVRQAAQNTALRLRTRFGDQPCHPWIIPSPLPLVYCMLSTMDGSGGQVLFVVREQPDGDLMMVDMMFNDHEGIKDCFSAVVDEEELEEMADAFGGNEFVDVSLERARTEVARAHQVTLDARRRLPPAFMVWQSWMEGDDPRPPEEFPLPSLQPSAQVELLAECTELLTMGEFDYWFFNPDEVQSFVSRYRRLRRRGQADRGQAPFESLLDEAIEGVVDERHGRILTDRLRRQAWLLAQIYEEEEVPLWALAAAAALEKGEAVEHPLLRAMMDRSLINAIGRYPVA